MGVMYETEEDRLAEVAVLVELQKHWGFADWHKNPVAYHIDFTLIDAEGKFMALAEVRCRNAGILTYPYIILSYNKYMNGRKYAFSYTRDRGEIAVPYFQVFHFKKGNVIKYIRLDDKIFEPNYYTKATRDDPRDDEPVIHIPVEDMLFLDGPFVL